jgi:hypothetical protein
LLVDQKYGVVPYQELASQENHKQPFQAATTTEKREDLRWGNLSVVRSFFARLTAAGRWTAEERHGDPSKCALGYIYMNLECTFKDF